MSGITQIECWYDCGYIENSLEIPPKTHELRDPDIILDGPFNPAKNREFSEIKVELPFPQAVNISYVRIHYDFNNGDNQIFYGWVDDVKLISDSIEAPLVNIVYHIDPWRTWNNKITYGSGFVNRAPSGFYDDRWQDYPYNYLVEDDDTGGEIKPSGETKPWNWIIVAAQQYDGDPGTSKVTAVRYHVFPITLDADKHIWVGADHDPHAIKGITPTLLDCCLGKLDECLGVDPRCISGAWYYPWYPLRELLIGSGTQDEPYRFSNRNVWKYEPSDAEGWLYGHFVSEPSAPDNSPLIFLKGTFFANVLHSTMPEPLANSTELNQLFLRDFVGKTIGKLPFKVPLNAEAYGSYTQVRGTYDVIVTSTSALIRFNFAHDESLATGYKMGLVYDYPLPSLEVNSNAWSSYVYSGQRQAEIDLRNAESTKNMIEGAVTGAIGGAQRGAVSGAILGPEAAVGTAIEGAVNNSVGSIFQGAKELLIDNKFEQWESDRRHAAQSSNVLQTGDFMYLVSHFYDFKEHKLNPVFWMGYCHPDTPSLKCIHDDITCRGVKHNVYEDDCNDLINNGGPMQITNLIIRGDIPVKAKNWIQAKFAKGVRIVSR